MTEAATERCRSETDLLGTREIPFDAYWGIHTLRAVENFSLGVERLEAFPSLVEALASVKQAAAMTNVDLGVLDPYTAEAIIAACERLRSGALLDQFPVEVIQGGAGTSTNMNANEVIANLALETLDLEKGSYDRIHPNGHVNLGQSTNDVYPTAVKLALILEGQRLIGSLRHLRGAFERKAAEFRTILKVGRTQLQDAVPMTLGQEFAAYAITIEEDEHRLAEALVHLHEINLGGTAVGTSIDTAQVFPALVRAHLANLTGLPLRTAPHLIEATQDVGVFVLFSATLKRIAVKLSKICNDLRLLSSGPRAGFGEINLPPRQAGSSIMPGKVNPVVPELVNQVAFEIIGYDTTITFAAEAGQLQLNAFEPIIVYSLLRGLRHLERSIATLADDCIDGITANIERLQQQVAHSLIGATLLNAKVGYPMASLIAHQALLAGSSLKQAAILQGLDEHMLEDLLGNESILRSAGIGH